MSEVTLQETVINGRWCLYLPEHRALRPEWSTGWEVERLSSMHANVNPGDVIYDIGTEEGDISALLQTWTTEHGSLCLFEPNDRVWSNIKAIWDGNELKKPLGMFPGFAGDLNRHLEAVNVDHWPDSADGPVISDHGFCNLSERPDIPVIRLDDFASLVGMAPDIITLDIEGAELIALFGAREILMDSKPLVYVSIHPKFMTEMYHQLAQDLHQYMGDLGYRAKWLATDHEEHWVFFHPFGREFKF